LTQALKDVGLPAQLRRRMAEPADKFAGHVGLVAEATYAGYFGKRFTRRKQSGCPARSSQEPPVVRRWESSAQKDSLHRSDGNANAAAGGANRCTRKTERQDGLVQMRPGFALLVENFPDSIMVCGNRLHGGALTPAPGRNL